MSIGKNSFTTYYSQFEVYVYFVQDSIGVYILTRVAAQASRLRICCLGKQRYDFMLQSKSLEKNHCTIWNVQTKLRNIYIKKIVLHSSSANVIVSRDWIHSNLHGFCRRHHDVAKDDVASAFNFIHFYNPVYNLLAYACLGI